MNRKVTEVLVTETASAVTRILYLDATKKMSRTKIAEWAKRTKQYKPPCVTRWDAAAIRMIVNRYRRFPAFRMTTFQAGCDGFLDEIQEFQ